MLQILSAVMNGVFFAGIVLYYLRHQFRNTLEEIKRAMNRSLFKRQVFRTAEFSNLVQLSRRYQKMRDVIVVIRKCIATKGDYNSEEEY